MNAGEHIWQAEKLLQEIEESPGAEVSERQAWAIIALTHAVVARARQESGEW